MKFHVYITPSALHRQLTAVVDLPPASIELSTPELDTLIRLTIAPLTPTTKTTLFNEYTVDGLRELGRIGELPTPAWLASAETEHAITGHHAMLGTTKEFLWMEFLNGVLGRKWTQERDWKVNENNLGYPILELTNQSSLLATFGAGKEKLRSHLPNGWSLNFGQTQSHLSVAHPGVVSASMHNYLDMAPGAANVFPARTHPLFYVALYEFWQYLAKEPIWAHLSPSITVDENRTNPEFSKQTILNLGLGAATYRWSWWMFMSHVFSPRSRALDILAKYHPNCYDGHHLMPRPANMEMNATLASVPPRLRVLNDPYHW